MPGIRIEGRPPGTASRAAAPPGVSQEGQLAQALGGDSYAGMTTGQMQALQAGGVGAGETVRVLMAEHARRNMAATAEAVGNARMPGGVTSIRTGGSLVNNANPSVGLGLSPMSAAFTPYSAIWFLRSMDAKLDTQNQISRQELDALRRSSWSPTSGMPGSGIGIPPPPGGWSGGGRLPPGN